MCVPMEAIVVGGARPITLSRLPGASVLTILLPFPTRPRVLFARRVRAWQVARASGERSDEEKKQLLARIAELTSELDAATATEKMLQVRVRTARKGALCPRRPLPTPVPALFRVALAAGQACAQLCVHAVRCRTWHPPPSHRKRSRSRSHRSFRALTTVSLVFFQHSGPNQAIA